MINLKNKKRTVCLVLFRAKMYFFKYLLLSSNLTQKYRFATLLIN